MTCCSNLAAGQDLSANPNRTATLHIISSASRSFVQTQGQLFSPALGIGASLSLLNIGEDDGLLA